MLGKWSYAGGAFTFAHKVEGMPELRKSYIDYWR